MEQDDSIEDYVMLNGEIDELRKTYGDGIIMFLEREIGCPHYECIKNDALIVNQECGIEIERDGSVPYCTINHKRFTKVKATLSKNKRIIGIIPTRGKPFVVLPN